MENKQEYQCPKCKSKKVIIHNEMLICKNCKHTEELIDFPVTENWNKIYKDRLS